jgi:hypothetical protein
MPQTKKLCFVITREGLGELVSYQDPLHSERGKCIFPLK